MTLSEKIEWLERATGEELIKEFQGRISWLANNGIEHSNYFEKVDDYNLIKAEILKRLNKEGK